LHSSFTSSCDTNTEDQRAEDRGGESRVKRSRQGKREQEEGQRERVTEGLPGQTGGTGGRRYLEIFINFIIPEVL
jgi:hypothetical protein